MKIPGRTFRNYCSVADPDQGSGAFLTPGSGMGKKSESGEIRIRDEQPGSYFSVLHCLETIFLGLNT
jgi:hypothetical protein